MTKRPNTTYSSIKQHIRHKKKLNPPLSQLESLNLVSWRDTVAPEILWAVILSATLDRASYLMIFRWVAKAAEGLGPDCVKGIEHTNLSALEPAAFDTLFAPVFANHEAKSALRSLPFLNGLPDRAHWQRTLFAPSRMSEAAGVKSVYDKYYGWPSGFVHAEWGAVRDTVFDLCLNPLHRLHRVPAVPGRDAPTVGPDIVKLTNLLLELLNVAYPPFKTRIRVSRSSQLAGAAEAWSGTTP